MDKKSKNINETAKEEESKLSRPSQSVDKPKSKSRDASKLEQKADKAERGIVCDTCNPNPGRKTGTICDECRSKPSTTAKTQMSGHKGDGDKSQTSTSQRQSDKTISKSNFAIPSTSLHGRGLSNVPKSKGLKKNPSGSTDASTGISSKTATVEKQRSDTTADNIPKTSDSEDDDIPELEPIDAPMEASTSSEHKNGSDDGSSSSRIKKKQTDTLQQPGLPKRAQFRLSPIHQTCSKLPKTEASSSNKETVRDAHGNPTELILRVFVKAVDRSKKGKANNDNVPPPKESKPTSTLSSKGGASEHTTNVQSEPYKLLRTILESPPLLNPSSTVFASQEQKIQETSRPVNLNVPLKENVATSSHTSIKTCNVDKLKNLLNEYFRKRGTKRSDNESSSKNTIGSDNARVDLDNLSRREIRPDYRTDKSRFASSPSLEDHVSSSPSYSEVTRREGTEFGIVKKTTKVSSQINAPATSSISHHEEENPPDSPIVPEICTTTSSMTSDQEDDTESSSKTSTSGNIITPEHMLPTMRNLLPSPGLSKSPSEFDMHDTDTYSSTGHETLGSSNAQVKIQVTDSTEVPPETKNVVDDSSKKSNEQTEKKEVTGIKTESIERPIVPTISVSSQGDDTKSSSKKSSSPSSGIPRGMHETSLSLLQHEPPSETNQSNTGTASPYVHCEQSIEEVANSSKASLKSGKDTDDSTEQSSTSERKTEESDDSVKAQFSQSERPSTSSATNPDQKEKIIGSESLRSSQSTFQRRRKLNVSNILKHEFAQKQPGYEIPRRAITRITDPLRTSRKWYSAPDLPSHAAVETVALPKSKQIDAERSSSIPNLFSSIKAYKSLYARQSSRVIEDTSRRLTSSIGTNEPTRVGKDDSGSSLEVKKIDDLTNVIFKKPKAPGPSQIKSSWSPNFKQEETKKGEPSASEDECSTTPDTLTPSGTDLEDELETMEPGVTRRISRRRRDRTPDTLVPEDHVAEEQRLDDFLDIESGTERDSIATSESPSDNTTPPSKSLKRSSMSDEKEDRGKPSVSTPRSSESPSSSKKKSKKSVRRNITPELSRSELKSTQPRRSPRKLDKRPLPFDCSTVDSEDECNDDTGEGGAGSKHPDIPSPSKQPKRPDNSSPRKTP